MKKNFLQDVTPPTHKRSIRDIPLPNGRLGSHEDVRNEPVINTSMKPKTMGDVKPKNVERPYESITPNAPVEPPKRRYNNSDFEERPKKSRKWILALLVVIAIVGFFILNRAKAEILVYPKTESFFVQDTYNIYDQNLSENSDGIGYKMLSIEKEASVNVPASGEKSVSNKASGMIRIFNGYSTKEQKLVERTRFETNKGLVYRIGESISVPGYTEKDGEIVPGHIDVEVFADEPGEKYNVEKTKFTIPGFDGLPQYDTMHAESITDLTGGFVGTKKVVSEEDKSNALNKLKENAKNKILDEINNSGDEFTIVFDENDVDYSKLTENDKDDGVELKITASVNAYVFNTKAVARFLADKQIANAPDGNVIIVNKNDIKFNIVKDDTSTDEEGSITTKLSVDGEVEVQWIIDTDLLANQLANKKKGELTDVITKDKGIVRAESKISPIWRNTFPKAPKIEILIQK